MPNRGRAQHEARIADMERQLEELRRQYGNGGGASQGGAPRNPNAAGGATRRSAAAGGGRATDGGGGGRGTLRPGDWKCPSCDASPCWARTVACFRCGAPRPGGRPQRPQTGNIARLAASPARQDMYLGPRGANGSRPMLGGRGGGGAAHGAAPGGPQVQPRPAARPAQAGVAAADASACCATDADGFTTINRATWPKVGKSRTSTTAAMGGDVAQASTWAEVAQRAGTRIEQQQQQQQQQQQPHQRHTAAPSDGNGDDCPIGPGGQDDASDPMQDVCPTDASHCQYNGYGSDEDDWDEDLGDDARAEDEEVDEGGGEQALSESELRRAWEDAKEAVKLLEANPRSPSPLLDAARRQRDSAEAAWRAAKPPHPLHKRLRWAQRAYDNAVGKQKAHQEELDRFDDDVARRRKVLLERCQADSVRTAKRLSALEELLAQGGQRHHQPPASIRAVRNCATGIDMDVGPALAAVADQLVEGSPPWMELQAAMASLANVEEELRAAAAADQGREVHPPTPAKFDISDGASVVGCAGEGSRGGGGPNASAADVSCANGPMDGPQVAQPSPAPKWVGPQSGSNRWGGREWRKVDSPVPAPAAADAQRAHGSSMHAKEQAAKLLAEQRAQLEAAQERERSSAEKARVQAEELARAQQVQVEHQRRAEADAKAAAETLRIARQAVAEAEAAEAARLEQEKQLLISRALPEDLQRAQEVHAQQAILIQQQQQQQQQFLQQQQLGAGAAAAKPFAETSTGIDADADRLMAMSEDELRRWHEESQQGNW